MPTIEAMLEKSENLDLVAVLPYGAHWPPPST